jgi:hypothetical protein
MKRCESCDSEIESYLIEMDGVLYNKNICSVCGEVSYQEAVVMGEGEDEMQELS